MVLMAAFLTQVGALQTAPILIAVVTAFLTMENWRQSPLACGNGLYRPLAP